MEVGLHLSCPSRKHRKSNGTLLDAASLEWPALFNGLTSWEAAPFAGRWVMSVGRPSRAGHERESEPSHAGQRDGMTTEEYVAGLESTLSPAQRKRLKRVEELIREDARILRGLA